VAGGGSVKAVSETALSPPTDAPRAKPEPVPAFAGPVWEVGGGLGFNLEGRLVLPAELQFNPWGIPLGFEVLFQAVPSDGKESSGAVLLKGRF
jgi:hypothetical protein